MSPKDFICHFLGLIHADNCNEETVRLLANVVDTTKDGLDMDSRQCLLLILNLMELVASHAMAVENGPFETETESYSSSFGVIVIVVVTVVVVMVAAAAKVDTQLIATLARLASDSK